MKKLNLLILAVFALFLVSCTYGTRDLTYSGNYVQNRELDIQNLDNSTLGRPDCLKTADFTSNGGEYTVAVLTDLHFGSTTKTDAPTKEFLNWLDAKKKEGKLPRFVLFMGDVMDHGYASEAAECKSFMEQIEAYGIPVFNTVGNHDLYNQGWDNWLTIAQSGMVKQTASAFRFTTNKFSWYTFDTGTTCLGSNQMNALKSYFTVDKNPKVVFSHYPIYIDRFLFCMEDTPERNELIDLLNKNNVKVYLAGHVHLYDYENFGNFKAYAIPSFRYQEQWGLLTVNETKESYTLKLVNKDFTTKNCD